MMTLAQAQALFEFQPSRFRAMLLREIARQAYDQERIDWAVYAQMIRLTRPFVHPEDQP